MCRPLRIFAKLADQDPQSANKFNGSTRTRTEEKDDGFSATGGGLVEEELEEEGWCRFENAIEAAATRPAMLLTSFSDDALMMIRLYYLASEVRRTTHISTTSASTSTGTPRRLSLTCSVPQSGGNNFSRRLWVIRHGAVNSRGSYA